MSTYTQKALAAASVLLFGVPTAALAHTNSIGYVGGGNGSVTFWYGNWHPGTTFNEGTLTLQGINGTSFSPTTVNWSLLSGTMPNGLIPGTNYFTSNGTQLVPYDPSIQTSYTWQGVTFTGLGAGDYQFTYNAAGSPTVNWMPMDSVILSSTVSLSAAALSGDANNNGILDIYETGGTPPPAPTVTSTASGNSIVTTSTTYGTRTTSGTPHRHVTGTDANGNETETHYTDLAVTTIPTTTVTTTTTPVTVTTWSDGSTTTSNGTPVVTSVTTDDNAGTTVVTQATTADWIKTRTYDVQKSDYVASAAPTITNTPKFKATESGGKQNVNLHLTTGVTTPTIRSVSTTPVYTKVYTDGTPTVVTTDPSVITYEISSTYNEYHTYKDWYGRVDQLQVLDGINDGINSLLNHEPSRTKERFRVFENNRFVQSYNADGYQAKSTIFGGGFELDLTKGWTVGFQYNNVNINLIGVDSKTTQKKDHFGIFSNIHGNTFTLNTNAAIANSKYNYARTLEYVFGNWGETTGSEWWVSNRLYWHLSKNVKPFVGYTVWNVSRNAYTETGSSQSARTVAAYNNTSHIGEAGLKLETRFGGKKKDLFGVSVEGAYATDSSYGVTASVDYKKILFVEGSHGVNNGVTNNSVAAKVKFRF